MRSAYSCRRSSAPGANSCGSLATTTSAPHTAAPLRTGAARRMQWCSPSSRSRAMASPQRRRSSRLPGRTSTVASGSSGVVLVVRPAAEDGDAVGVLEADDGGAVGAQQAPGVQRDEREDAGRRRAGGDRGRHAPQRGLLLGHPALLGLELARPAGGAGQQLAPGHDHAADEAVDRHDDDELAREVALDGVRVVEEGQRVHDPARQPVGQRLARRVEERARRRRRTTGSRAPASRCPR